MRTIMLIMLSALLGSVLWAQQLAGNAPATASSVPAATPPAPVTPSDLSVAAAAIALGLEGYTPVEPGDLFPADVKRLYCYTQIKGAKDSTEIEHRWYWNDDLITSIPLKVKSSNWKTYSIKNIYPGMTGEWMVAIVNPGNSEEVLKTLKFTIK
jgi:hypothetical protein